MNESMNENGLIIICTSSSFLILVGTHNLKLMARLFATADESAEDFLLISLLIFLSLGGLSAVLF